MNCPYCHKEMLKNPGTQFAFWRCRKFEYTNLYTTLDSNLNHEAIMNKDDSWFSSLYIKYKTVYYFLRIVDSNLWISTPFDATIPVIIIPNRK
jgi:hypothetical protein